MDYRDITKETPNEVIEIMSESLDDFKRNYFKLRSWKSIILNYLESIFDNLINGLEDVIKGFFSLCFSVLLIVLFPLVLIIRIPFLWKFGSNTRQIIRYWFKYKRSKSASKLVNLKNTLTDIKQWKINHGEDGKMFAYNWIEQFTIKEMKKAEKREGL